MRTDDEQLQAELIINVSAHNKTSSLIYGF